jgi:hypothetical protein
MRRIDHDLIGRPDHSCQFFKYPAEHAKPAPADETVVNGLVWTVVFRRIAPAQPIANDKDNSAQHTPIINPRNAMSKRKIRRNPLQLRIRKPYQITHAGLLPARMNQLQHKTASNLTGPEPKSRLVLADAGRSSR